MPDSMSKQPHSATVSLFEYRNVAEYYEKELSAGATNANTDRTALAFEGEDGTIVKIKVPDIHRQLIRWIKEKIAAIRRRLPR